MLETTKAVAAHEPSHAPASDLYLEWSVVFKPNRESSCSAIVGLGPASGTHTQTHTHTHTQTRTHRTAKQSKAIKDTPTHPHVHTSAHTYPKVPAHPTSPHTSTTPTRDLINTSNLSAEASNLYSSSFAIHFIFHAICYPLRDSLQPSSFTICFIYSLRNWSHYLKFCCSNASASLFFLAVQHLFIARSFATFYNKYSAPSCPMPYLPPMHILASLPCSTSSLIVSLVCFVLPPRSQSLHTLFAITLAWARRIYREPRR